jgi:hypothetical protein
MRRLVIAALLIVNLACEYYRNHKPLPGEEIYYVPPQEMIGVDPNTPTRGLVRKSESIGEQPGRAETTEPEWRGNFVPPPPAVGVALIRPLRGSSIHGTATLVKSDGRLRLRVVLEGVPPGTYRAVLGDVRTCSQVEAGAPPALEASQPEQGLGGINVGQDGNGRLVASLEAAEAIGRYADRALLIAPVEAEDAGSAAQACGTIERIELQR